MKKFLLIVAFAIVLQQLWYLKHLLYQNDKPSFAVQIQKLPPIPEMNNTVLDFFSPDIWQLSEADRPKAIKKDDSNQTQKKLYDINTTVEMVLSKGRKKLCRGKKCLTIKAIISGTILLLQEDNGTIIPLKPGDTVFKNVTLQHIYDTRLLFLNKDTNKTYNLEFFSYTQKKKTTNANLNRQREAIHEKKQ